MSAWSNTDAYANSKPKFPDLRQVREVYELRTANSTTSGATIITFVYNDGGQNNVANVGVIVGSYAYGTGLTANGTANELFRVNETGNFGIGTTSSTTGTVTIDSGGLGGGKISTSGRGEGLSSNSKYIRNMRPQMTTNSYI